jgi:hypothetical protein
MSDSETQSDYKIIETKINLMESMLDSYIENNSYPTIKQIQAQHPTGIMSLRKALNILVRETEKQLPETIDNPTKEIKELIDAIAKVKKYVEYL